MSWLRLPMPNKEHSVSNGIQIVLGTEIAWCTTELLY